MKKLIQTILLLCLAPALAVGQALTSQGLVTVNDLQIANTTVRLLAHSSGENDYDTLDVTTTGVNGYYSLMADLLQGQTDPFVETDACPYLQYAVSIAGYDTINFSCSDDIEGIGLNIGAYSYYNDNMRWYFFTNFGSNVASYNWLVDGYTYTSKYFDHIFDEPGTYEVVLDVVLTTGETGTAYATAIAGEGAVYYCNALFFGLQDTVPDGYIYFVNNSMGSNLTFEWDFGDGTTSNEQNPTHFYDGEQEIYTVCVSITGDDCTDVHCTEVGIAMDGSGVMGSGKPAGTISDDEGFTFVVVPVSEMTSGQNEIESQAPLSVYPNPSTGMITLEINLENGGNGMVKITDVTGKTVLQNNIATVSSLNTISINMNDLTDGVYLIQYIGKQNSKVQKVVLQR